MAQIVDPQSAIEAAKQALRELYPEFEFLGWQRREQLECFPQQSGWRIWFSVDDPDFGMMDRPVEVNESSGEAQIVRVL